MQKGNNVCLRLKASSKNNCRLIKFYSRFEYLLLTKFNENVRKNNQVTRCYFIFNCYIF